MIPKLRGRCALMLSCSLAIGLSPFTAIESADGLAGAQDRPPFTFRVENGKYTVHAEEVSLSALAAAIEEQGPLYNPIDAEGDVTPERMNEVAAEAEALPPQVLVGEEGAPDVNLQAEAAKQDQRVKAIDEIWGCMFGGPDG